MQKKKEKKWERGKISKRWGTESSEEIKKGKEMKVVGRKNKMKL